MNTYYLQKQLYLLPLLLIAVSSCGGKAKTDLTIASLSTPRTMPVGQPKIKTPEGINVHDNIRCGLHDKDGYLWFCSAGEGVYRYDGKVFISFTEKDGLNNNRVWSMLEDRAGYLWFGTDSGLCRYDGKTFTDVPIIVATDASMYPYKSNISVKAGVSSMMQDKSGKFWFGTTEGVYCYNGKTFTHFLENDGIINNDSLHLKKTGSILEDKNGHIWFGSNVTGHEGVCHYDGTSITSFKPRGDDWIRSIIEDRNGYLLFVTRHEGVLRFDGKTLTNISERGGPDNWSITSILEDKAGNLWFGQERGSDGDEYYGGLWRYDGKTFTEFTTKDGLRKSAVWCIVEDKKGNIWAGSRGNGLSRYDGKTFTNFTE